MFIDSTIRRFFCGMSIQIIPGKCVYSWRLGKWHTHNATLHLAVFLWSLDIKEWGPEIYALIQLGHGGLCMLHCCILIYLGEVVDTLLEGVHNDIIQLCQSLWTGVHVGCQDRIPGGFPRNNQQEQLEAQQQWELSFLFWLRPFANLKLSNSPQLVISTFFKSRLPSNSHSFSIVSTLTWKKLRSSVAFDIQNMRGRKSDDSCWTFGAFISPSWSGELSKMFFCKSWVMLLYTFSRLIKNKQSCFNPAIFETMSNWSVLKCLHHTRKISQRHNSTSTCIMNHTARDL